MRVRKTWTTSLNIILAPNSISIKYSLFAMNKVNFLQPDEPSVAVRCSILGTSPFILSNLFWPSYRSKLRAYLQDHPGTGKIPPKKSINLYVLTIFLSNRSLKAKGKDKHNVKRPASKLSCPISSHLDSTSLSLRPCCH